MDELRKIQELKANLERLNKLVEKHQTALNMMPMLFECIDFKIKKINSDIENIYDRIAEIRNELIKAYKHR